jgi:hypothetical protein
MQVTNHVKLEPGKSCFYKNHLQQNRHHTHPSLTPHRCRGCRRPRCVQLGFCLRVVLFNICSVRNHVFGSSLQNGFPATTRSFRLKYDASNQAQSIITTYRLHVSSLQSMKGLRQALVFPPSPDKTSDYLWYLRGNIVHDGSIARRCQIMQR